MIPAPAGIKPRAYRQADTQATVLQRGAASRCAATAAAELLQRGYKDIFIPQKRKDLT